MGFCDGSAATAHAGDAECNQAIQCMWVLEYGMWAKNRPKTKVVELNEGYPAMQSVWQLLCSLRRKTQKKFSEPAVFSDKVSHLWTHLARFFKENATVDTPLRLDRGNASKQGIAPTE